MDKDEQKKTAPTTAQEPTRDYFFPVHGVVVAAASREEAEAKLAVLLKAESK